MTQLFDEKGNVTGVTVIEARTNYVTQVKTKDKDGYTAVQLGFGETAASKLTRGEQGHLGQLKANDKHPKRRDLTGVPNLGTLEENRMKDVSAFKEGDVLKADIFVKGDFVDVSGVMKGRGFTGPHSNGTNSIAKRRRTALLTEARARLNWRRRNVQAT